MDKDVCDSESHKTFGQQRECEIRPPTQEKIMEWSATLSSANIGYRLVRSGKEWIFVLSGEAGSAALREIQAYEKSDARWPKQVTLMKPLEAYDTWASSWGVLFLIWLYVWLGPYDSENTALVAGSAHAVRILDGEWWRVVTALTIHSGVVHLAGNALCLLVIGHALFRMIGGGLGWLLILASGVAGNLATAFLIKYGHPSVGASTAGFGALGIISAYQSLRCLRHSGEWRSVWSRTWIPLCAGLALLGFTGTAPGSDIAAHGFGFVSGVVLAIPFGWHGARNFPEWGQRVLEMVCIVTVMLCWRIAFFSIT